ncbi:T9SS type A sorting domain-containing protein, partial [candidate division KSB1 bacterium]|nr:T9SS type A sorting domain-containing protein [candidate division KSB1 bacterium]
DAARQLLVVKCQTVPSEEYVLRISGSDLVSAVSSEPMLPAFFQFRAPHPNPFAEVTQIAYQLTERATVQVEIFNLVGQRLKALINTTQPAGEHTVAWRGDDERGLPVAAGVYVVRVKVNAGAEEFLASRKISVLR